jgi:UPF0716 protein FxsA
LRKFPLFALALLIVPFIEIWLLIKVGGAIGALPTFLLVILASIAGGFLLRQQGMTTLRRFQQSLAQGQLPATEMLEGVMIVIGAVLLMLPGFFTDMIGALFLIPPLRRALIRLSSGYSAGAIQRRVNVFTHTSAFNQTTTSRGNARERYDYEGEVIQRKD